MVRHFVVYDQCGDYVGEWKGECGEPTFDPRLQGTEREQALIAWIDATVPLPEDVPGTLYRLDVTHTEKPLGMFARTRFDVVARSVHSLPVRTYVEIDLPSRRVVHASQSAWPHLCLRPTPTRQIIDVSDTPAAKQWERLAGISFEALRSLLPVVARAMLD
jgi:hypothetical protein